MRIAALIVAAGRGARAATDARQPKQYCPIGGEAMLTRTISAFAAHPRVDDILVVVHPDDTSLYEAASASFASRLQTPVIGGTRRQDSVRAGLEALVAHGPGLVLIHDAARPFIDADLIARVIAGLDDEAGALPCLPVTDTLKRGEGGRITGTVARDALWRAQTPQGFKFDAILGAHRAASEEPAREFTDDAAVAEWFGIDVALVEGSEHNRKLTTAEDLAIADQMLRTEGGPSSPMTIRVGMGYDVHALGPGDAVILCGVSIPHTKKLVGHSDADVGLHALTDALLGAIADGDIGVHFPPSDDRWRGASSDIFLKAAGDKIKERGGEIVHVDVTLLCETPHIGPHRDAMRAFMAEALGLEMGQVSIKATTNEGLGFVGRSEGIAAMATATVMLP
ncbi:MAG: bifunctional 2-C-methyl-D-erythritol 4-phosphate cytidylyltransferase/2-C-methyl-D-erythritol 2,4-cyclodiphosphate synthase [Hyphomicrobiaceae bacterium]|jgi:2-C-methyl-D-erythritol 4-phosphate cytidylyltransferase/2-C-methyl-D-erythritol 2,4-cyclodiphosphate synthase|nr:bifunctional 2-C-methyl-D-erythritol 4-phosphate cytidylyltransferase/2-C-methyl-D-erythritol 2,4-cyclodiphosphate synthase [Hyphomicrobiaceae bacterium]MDX2449890.1 bifunctional 2-C-methyl-D-erythritol 4-phosphate cytidylyltransferase/2-C-methyl-D-erythritol 2,4-cyclodiphosphate synthase [Hyphomicrobiaceae bacterium]